MRNCLIILIFLCHFSAYCQHEIWHIKDLLKKVERSSEIKFSYEESLLEDITLQVTRSQLEDTSRLIPFLQAKLGLRFEQVNNVYYIIRPFNDEDRVDICGVVIDEEGKSIPGALIDGDMNAYSAVTDQDGYFKIEDVPITYHSVSDTWVITSAEADLKNIWLHYAMNWTMIESVGFLETVTVKDYLAVGIAKEGNHIKIFPSEINILPGHTEPDLNAKHPAVSRREQPI